MPSTARIASTTFARCVASVGQNGDVANLRRLLDADEIDGAQRCAGFADSSGEPGERAGRSSSRTRTVALKDAERCDMPAT